MSSAQTFASKPAPVVQTRSAEEETKSANAEYGLLAEMIKGTQEAADDTFKLNLFPEVSSAMMGIQGGVSAPSDPNTVEINLGSDKGKLNDMVSKFGDVALPKQDEDDDDDLLAMMDAANS
jgi:hypothetical protein